MSHERTLGEEYRAKIAQRHQRGAVEMAKEKKRERTRISEELERVAETLPSLLRRAIDAEEAQESSKDRVWSTIMNPSRLSKDEVVNLDGWRSLLETARHLDVEIGLSVRNARDEFEGSGYEGPRVSIIVDLDQPFLEKENLLPRVAVGT